jgi:hypothetical protein
MSSSIERELAKRNRRKYFGEVDVEGEDSGSVRKLKLCHVT